MAKDTWYRVDNVAKVFLASVNDRDPRTFRMTCTLKEEIEQDVLTEAVLQAAKERPQYQVTILRGLFWHYMEPTDDVPVVEEEHDRICGNLIDERSFGKLHYRVTYYHNRINLEVSHAIADGNGALEFLNLIVEKYLKMKHPDVFANLTMSPGTSESDLSEDSFRQFYSKEVTKGKKAKRKKAYHIKGKKHPYNQTQFLEVHMPIKDVLAKARELNVTLTTYVGTALMMAIYKDMPLLMRTKPITISMPVNLRNYYPSATARNFFNSVFVSHVFKNDDTFESVAAGFQEDLKKELTPEAVALRMHDYEQIERYLFIRMVPLFIKNPVVNAVNNSSVKRVTAVLSNLGKLPISPDVKDYVDSYNAFCSTSGLFVVISSYKDELVMGISSAYRNTQVLRDFLKTFSDTGIETTVYSTELTE